MIGQHLPRFFFQFRLDLTDGKRHTMCERVQFSGFPEGHLVDDRLRPLRQNSPHVAMIVRVVGVKRIPRVDVAAAAVENQGNARCAIEPTHLISSHQAPGQSAETMRLGKT